MKLPAFQLCPDEWREAVQSLSYYERGVWFELFLLMWESEKRGVLLLQGRKPRDTTIARFLGLETTQTALLLKLFVQRGLVVVDPDTKTLVSPVLLRQEYLRHVRAIAGRKGGSATFCSSKSARLLKQNVVSKSQPLSDKGVTARAESGQQALFEDAEQPSERKKERTKERKKDLVCVRTQGKEESKSWELVIHHMSGRALKTDRFRAEWEAWRVHRKEIHKPLTPTTIQRQIKLLESFGHDGAIAAIDQSIRNGWQGLFEPRDAKPTGRGAGKGGGPKGRRPTAADRGEYAEDNRPLPAL